LLILLHIPIILIFLTCFSVTIFCYNQHNFATHIISLHQHFTVYGNSGCKPQNFNMATPLKTILTQFSTPYILTYFTEDLLNKLNLLAELKVQHYQYQSQLLHTIRTQFHTLHILHSQSLSDPPDQSMNSGSLRSRFNIVNAKAHE